MVNKKTGTTNDQMSTTNEQTSAMSTINNFDRIGFSVGRIDL